MATETQYRVEIALELLSQANVAMLTAIETAVKESETEEVKYNERTIKYNGYGELVMVDEYDYETDIDDLSADDLYDICLELAQ